jgi:hypothetical protein
MILEPAVTARSRVTDRFGYEPPGRWEAQGVPGATAPEIATGAPNGAPVT